MKVKMGGQSLNPDVLFKVSSDPPPDHLRTVSEILAWQKDEHTRMLAAVTEAFRLQLLAAFEQFARDVEGESEH